MKFKALIVIAVLLPTVASAQYNPDPYGVRGIQERYEQQRIEQERNRILQEQLRELERRREQQPIFEQRRQEQQYQNEMRRRYGR